MSVWKIHWIKFCGVTLIVLLTLLGTATWGKTCRDWEKAGQKCHYVAGPEFVQLAEEKSWKFGQERRTAVWVKQVGFCKRQVAEVIADGQKCIFSLFGPPRRKLAKGWKMKTVQVEGMVQWLTKPAESTRPFAKFMLNIPGVQKRRLIMVILVGPPDGDWQDALSQE